MSSPRQVLKHILGTFTGLHRAVEQVVRAEQELGTVDALSFLGTGGVGSRDLAVVGH
jgi:hypothetical protein